MPKDFTIRPDLDLSDVKRKLAGLSRTPTTLKLDTKGFKPLGKITGELGEFEKSLAASNARVIAFGASTSVIMGIQRAFSGLIRTTIDVEKQLTDINVIMNESASGIAKFGKELFRVAGQTGQSFTTIATAATELARQGLSAEETLLRVRDAMILTRLSGLSAVESVSALTAAINSFNKVAITSTELVNKMANVDAAFAVSAGDLAKAISRVGSSAQSAGVGIDQLMAIVTSAQQTTARGGAVIGNSFKTIFTRIQRPRVIKELEKLGIAVRGFSGDMLPAVDVLNNMAKSFDLLSRAQRAQISELVGGVFQVNILKAAMADLNKETSIYSRALGISASSTDQAIRRNEQLNKTLSATLNETVANFQSVGTEIGKMSLEPAIRRILSLTNKALKVGADPKQGEDVGATMGGAIFKGLGDFLKGPGLAIGGIALFKVFSRIIMFSKDAFKTIVGVGQASQQAAAQNAKVLQLLQKQPDLVRQVAERTMTLKQAHDQVLGALVDETAALRTMDVLAKDVASTLSGVGLGIGELGLVAAAGGKKGGKRKAAGHVPNAVAETIGAVVGGYTPGKIAQTNIQGLGRVTYNTAETIKQFPGFAQAAIMPPERSRAGKTYRQTFSGKHGFNPYANAGMVPNFASPIKIKPGQSVSYGGKTISIEAAKIIVKKMDLNPRPGRSSDERTQKMLSALKGGKFSGLNNDASASLLLTNGGLGQSYSSALKGRTDAAAAKAAAVEAKKIRQASAPRLNTVLMRNLEQVGTNVHGVARYGMKSSMMPDARGRFQSSFEKRYKQMMDGLADDMFSQGGAGKMKGKLMSQFTAQGLDKNARPQVMGRVWESFLQGMGGPVDPRLATSGMARKDFSNYKMKPAFRGLFTPGPATQMGFTGGEARLSGISSKKAYEKMGIDPRLYMSDGFVPNFGKLGTSLNFTRRGSMYDISGSVGDVLGLYGDRQGVGTPFWKKMKKAYQGNLEVTDHTRMTAKVGGISHSRNPAHLEELTRKHTGSYDPARKIMGHGKRIKSAKGGRVVTKSGHVVGGAEFYPTDLGSGKYKGFQFSRGDAKRKAGMQTKKAFFKGTIGKNLVSSLMEMDPRIQPGKPRGFNEGVRNEVDFVDLGNYFLAMRPEDRVPMSMESSVMGSRAKNPTLKHGAVSSLMGQGRKRSGGFIPSLMRRRVFDIDAYKQKYAADPAMLQKRLGQTGAGNIKGLFDYDVMQAGKKGHLTVVNAAAGAGKTTFAMGNKGSMAYSGQGIKAGDRSVVVRASETMTAGEGGLFNKSYTPYVDKYISLLPPGGAVKQGRRSRNQSGQYMFGREGGQTAGANTDFTAPAAVIQSMVGGKHRALTRGMGENQRWGKAGALPNVHTLPVAAVSGAFSPFHMGHQKVLDAAQKSGLPTIVHVAAGKNRKHDIGLSIGRKSSLIREGNPGVAVASGSNLPENFRAPKDMVVKIGGKTHNIKKGDVIQATAEGSKLFVGSDRMSKSGVRGIYNQVEVPRGSRGLSATEIRGDIMSGDRAALSKKLPGNWNKFISSNLGDIQKQQGMMAGREAKKLAVINEEKARLWGKMGVPYDPYGRNPALNKKRVAEYPKETAMIAELNAASKKAVSHKWRKRVFPNLAEGYVPNFRTSSMNDALKRSAIAETAAGQGNVRFGLDPRLSATGNPLGIGTFNTSEGSLSKAIAMHRGAGVNVQDLRSLGKDQQRAARGIIPNFADAPPSVWKSMQRFLAANTGSTVATGRGAFGRGERRATRMEVWSSDRQLRKQAKLNGSETGDAIGGAMGGMGMGLMFGGPMAASMAARVAEQQGVIGGRTAAGVSGAIEGGSTGLMLASFAPSIVPALAKLPGKVKLGLAVAVTAFTAMMGKTGSTFEFDMKELSTAAQKTQADFQKMANASAKYIEATEAFEAAITDSKVTARTLARLSRESNKQLALLSSEVRGKIAQGVSPEERRDIVMGGVTDRQGQVEQATIGARLAQEKLLGTEAVGKTGFLGLGGGASLTREQVDKLAGEGKAIAFGLKNFDEIVKAVGKRGEGALADFGFSTSGPATTSGIDKLQKEGILEETLANRMKEALGAGSSDAVEVMLTAMKEIIKLEAQIRDKMAQITIAKERENKELNKLKRNFEVFKMDQETARKLTDLDLKAGARSGKRFLSAKGQAQFGFEVAQLENTRKGKQAVGQLQFNASEGIRKGEIGLPAGSAGQISSLLRPQTIDQGFLSRLEAQITGLNRTPADAEKNEEILNALISIRDKTITSLGEQKQQTAINKKIRDLALQEAREQQNLGMGGGIESFMNGNNARFEKLTKSSLQQRLGIGAGRGFVNQSAVVQELLGGDLGAAKGITTKATAQAMVPQRRREMLIAARQLEGNARFQGGDRRKATLAQARELRSVANDPKRLMEAMTQQAAEFFNVDTLRDGVAGGLDSSQVGQAWLKALPAQARADTLSPFQRGAKIREIREAEDEAKQRQAQEGVEGTIKHFTNQLERLAKKMKETVDKAGGLEEENNSRGFIPSFNFNRTREMNQAGVSKSQTYQWNVPGFGPAIGNRMDEPSPSALQMAVMSHGNPRSAGARRGFTPNFAAAQDVKYPFESQHRPGMVQTRTIRGVPTSGANMPGPFNNWKVGDIARFQDMVKTAKSYGLTPADLKSLKAVQFQASPFTQNLKAIRPLGFKPPPPLPVSVQKMISEFSEIKPGAASTKAHPSGTVTSSGKFYHHRIGSLGGGQGGFGPTPAKGVGPLMTLNQLNAQADALMATMNNPNLEHGARSQAALGLKELEKTAGKLIHKLPDAQKGRLKLGATKVVGAKEIGVLGRVVAGEKNIPMVERLKEIKAINKSWGMYAKNVRADVAAGNQIRVWSPTDGVKPSMLRNTELRIQMDGRNIVGGRGAATTSGFQGQSSTYDFSGSRGHGVAYERSVANMKGNPSWMAGGPAEMRVAFGGQDIGKGTASYPEVKGRGIQQNYRPGRVFAPRGIPGHTTMFGEFGGTPKLGKSWGLQGRGPLPATGAADWAAMRATALSEGSGTPRGGGRGGGAPKAPKVPGAPTPKGTIPRGGFKGSGMSMRYMRNNRGMLKMGRGISKVTKPISGALHKGAYGYSGGMKSAAMRTGLRGLGWAAFIASPLIENAMLKGSAADKRNALFKMAQEGDITMDQYDALLKAAVSGQDFRDVTGRATMEEDVRGSFGGATTGLAAALGTAALVSSATGFGLPVGIALGMAAGIVGYFAGDWGGRNLIPENDMSRGLAAGYMKDLSPVDRKQMKRLRKEDARTKRAINTRFKSQVTDRISSAKDKVDGDPYLTFLRGANAKYKDPKTSDFIDDHTKSEKLKKLQALHNEIFNNDGSLKNEDAINELVEGSMKLPYLKKDRPEFHQRRGKSRMRAKEGYASAAREEMVRMAAELGLDISKNYPRDSEADAFFGPKIWDPNKGGEKALGKKYGDTDREQTQKEIDEFGKGKGGWIKKSKIQAEIERISKDSPIRGATPEDIYNRYEEQILAHGRSLRGARGRRRGGETPYDRWLRDPHTQAILSKRRYEKRQGSLDKGALSEHKRKYGDWAPEMKSGKGARAFADRRQKAQDEFYRMNRAGTLPDMFAAKEGLSTAARREAFIRTSLMKGSINEANKGWVKVPGSGTFVERGTTQADSAITPYTTKVGPFTIPSAILMGGSAKPITPEEMEAEYKNKELEKEKIKEKQKEGRRQAELKRLSGYDLSGSVTITQLNQMWNAGEIDKDQWEQSMYPKMEAKHGREYADKRYPNIAKRRFNRENANTQSGGFIPNFSAAAMELNNSYSRARTRVVNLRGIGLANTEETLGHHPRFTQPFVNPPEGSKEGMLHKMRSMSRTGVNPYMIPNTSLSSQGSIPEIDTSGAQSSLGALTQEFDNLKTALAQGGFIPNASDSGTSTVTNNMSVYSNGGIPAGGSAVNSDFEGQMKTLMDTVKRGLPEEYARASMPAR